MAYTKIARLLSTILVLSLSLFGQYSGTPSLGLEDNPADCDGSANCWQQAGTGAVISIAAAADGTLYKIGSTNVLSQWKYSTEGWSGSSYTGMGGHIVKIAAGSATNVVGVSSESSNNVYLLSGSAWTNIHGTATECAASIDGSVWCIGSDGNTYSYHGGAWYGTSPLQQLASIAACMGMVIGIGPDANLYRWDGTSWTESNGSALGFTPNTNHDSIACGVDQTVAMIDSSNNVHLSRDFGATWTRLGSSYATHVQAPSSTMILKGASNVFHYTGTMLTAIETVTGSYSGCPGCNTPGYHTGTASVSFPHGLNPGSSQVQTIYNDQMLVSHADYSPSCDPVFTFANTNPECNAALSSTVECPVMGSLLNVSSNNPFSGASVWQMDGYYKINGALEDCEFSTTFDEFTCNVPVVPWCSNGTQVPAVSYLLTLESVAEQGAYLSGSTFFIGPKGGPYPFKQSIGYLPSNSSVKQRCDLAPRTPSGIQ